MDSIYNTLLEILKKVKNRPDLYKEEMFDEPLTGSFFKFNGIDLAYVAMEVIQAFHINLSADDLTEYKWNSINGIHDCIKSKIYL